MKDFQVASTAEYLSKENLELTMAAFGEFYNSVTFKHQRRMQFNLICESSRVSEVLDFAEMYKIEDVLELVPFKAERQKDQLPLNSTLLILPTEQRAGRITREALSKSVPVVSYLNDSVGEYIDQTCGMFVRKRGFGFNVEDFSKILRMIYFDPEVRKILHKGAKAKYVQISGVGQKTVPSTKAYSKVY